MDRIEPDEGIDRFQGTLTPLLEYHNDLVGNLGDGRRRELHAVDLLDMFSDLGITVSQGIEGEDLLLDSIRKGALVFLEDLRFEGPVTISGHFQLERAGGALDGLG